MSLDALDADRERLLDFFDSERLCDLFFDSDLLRDFFDREERLRDLLFDDDRFLLLDRVADFLQRESDLDALERFDSAEEDLDRDERCCFALALGDVLFAREADLDVDRRLGDADDFLPRDRDRDFLSRDGDMEDLALPATDTGDFVHDRDADLEYDLFFFTGDLERRLDLASETLGNNGGDSLGERSFVIMLSSRNIITGAGEREDDSLLEVSFLAIGDEFFLPETLGDVDNRRFVLLFAPGDVESIFSKDCWGSNDGGDSLGDLILIAASSRVSGSAGEGDLLDTGDCTAGRVCATGSFDTDLSRIGATTFCMTIFGGSFGRAMSSTFSSRLSTLIFVGLITFFSNVSRAFAASPLCSLFRVFSSMILRSSSSSSRCCLPGSSSAAKSASSSLDDLRLTLGATAIFRAFLFLDVERDFTLSFLAPFF